LGIGLESDSLISELELMQKIFESDAQAIEALYDKYVPLLYTFIKKIVKDKKAAEEALESVFLTICKKINYFDFETKNSYTWIITLAKNKAVYDLRKGKGFDSAEENSNGSENDFITPRFSHLSEPFDLEKALEYKDKIENALNSLTDAQQYVIYLAFYEGLTQVEIADRLKIPLQTVESKIKISLIKLNENFAGGSYSFSVKNQVIDLIYPFVLGCLKEDEIINAYNDFRSSEIFPWKLLGKYQNLVSLLPIILDLENPPEELREKIISQLKKAEEDIGSSISQEDLIIEEPQTEKVKTQNEKEETEAIENSEDIVLTLHHKEENDEAEQAEMFKSIEESIEGIKHIDPEYIRFERHRNYTGLITFIFVLIFIVATVIAYLFYKDRSDYYEGQINTLNENLRETLNESQNKPEIPGIGDLNKPQTVELKNTGIVSSADGKIIFSFQDKKGYLYLHHLPSLAFDNAYQLWGNFNGNFVSLGLFKVSAKPDYYPFTLPTTVVEDPVEFYLIESTASGYKRPGNKIYLKGKFE
jgi:RNA polymerase sigma-70 factor, ECF subfamily